ncbi:MAG: hypothetical protein M1820_003845 [Bogoriella megaspora]|nr:MAG: hypothetical protein M1820_003845 [Bogoriella megaspora]
MAPYQNVAIAGATGNLGPVIVSHLLAANYKVTALTRHGSNATQSLPSAVTSTPVDYTSIASLTSALQGQDVLISTLNPAEVDQIPLFSAAISAGVQRILPGEFGCDPTHPAVESNPFFAKKKEVKEWVEAHAGEGPGKMSYTLVSCGPFLDWCLGTPLLVNWQGATEVYGGGERRTSATLLEDVGRAVVGTLKHPEETRDRAVFVQSTTISQKQILEIAGRVKGKAYETTEWNTEELWRDGLEGLQKGDRSKLFGLLKVAIWGENVGSVFDQSKLDNELFGVKELSEKELEEVVAKYAK